MDLDSDCEDLTTSLAICRRRSTLGSGDPGSQFVAGPQIFEGFPVVYHRHSVCDDMERPSASPPRILGLEPRLAYVWLNELHVLTLPETRCVTTAIIR